jgi:hypothetical protein
MFYMPFCQAGPPVEFFWGVAGGLAEAMKAIAPAAP